MAANPQPAPEPQPQEIPIDRRFGKRSDFVRRQISLGVKRYMRRNPEKVTALISKLREERLGKPQSRLRGRTGPPGSTSKSTPSWEIVELRANGASLPAIAKACGMKLSGADYRVHALDLPRGPYDVGEPFTKDHARHLWQVSGLTYGELAKEIGISSRSVQADLSPKRSDEYIYPERARKYLALRDRVVQALLAGAPGEKGTRVRWGKSNVLKTFFPDLGTLRSLLVKTIPAIGDWLRENPKGPANALGEWVCGKAQFENKRTPRRLCWRKLVRWLPQLMPTLMRNRTNLARRISENQSQPGLRLWQVAHRLLADHLGVSPSILQISMEGKTRRIAPDILRRLIEDLARPTNDTWTPARKRRRGQRGLGQQTPALKRMAAACIKCSFTKRKTARLLYPGDDPDDAYNKTKQLFRNHPDIMKIAAALSIHDAHAIIAAFQAP